MIKSSSRRKIKNASTADAGRKCREINIKLLLATNKEPAPPWCLYSLLNIHFKQRKLAGLTAAVKVNSRKGLNFTQNTLVKGQSWRTDQAGVSTADACSQLDGSKAQTDQD